MRLSYQLDTVRQWCLSTKPYQLRPLIQDQTYQLRPLIQDLINRDLLSTRLIVGKVGPGMWCDKFNSTSNVLVCETQRKVNMYRCVSECVCVCLSHIRSIMVVSRSLLYKSVYTSPTRLKNLSGDSEVGGTVRYCLTIRTNSGNSCGYCFHHIRGSVSLVTCWTSMYV
jgi:hypothetical protein